MRDVAVCSAMAANHFNVFPVLGDEYFDARLVYFTPAASHNERSLSFNNQKLNLGIQLHVPVSDRFLF